VEALADKLLAQLDGVRSTGENRWLARCPAHEDKSPSLAVREIDDRLLLHCFAGCGVAHIVGAVGLQLSDLFPPRLDDSTTGRKVERRPFPAVDILRCLSNEITALMLCASDLARGETLDNDTKERLMKAVQRFYSAISAGGLQ